MSQICYKVEILLSLLKKNKHIREIAKELNTNQMTIKRKLEELEKENVVDYTFEGKNKVYFIKKTFEAKQSICIAELEKTKETIKANAILRTVFEEIRKKDIHLAILFGSFAKKTQTTTSDIDIYIETTEISLKHEIEKINSRLSVKIGKYDKENSLIKEIETNHVIIKGVEEFYEKNRFFS